MYQSNKMKEIPYSERPYEKCERFGVQALTEAELLAVLLRTGVEGESVLSLAHKLLCVNGTEDVLSLYDWNKESLMKIKGIGRIKAIQILCLLEFARRLSKAEALPKLCFETAKSIADYYMHDMRYLKQEHLKLLLLDTKIKLIGEKDMFVGTKDASLVSPRELFIEALQKQASSVILLHNHPSGDPTPSKEDILVTKRIQAAGKMIGIELLDHIIIGNNCYISFHEKKII